MANSTNGNGTKWGVGFNGWLRSNWLLLMLVVGGAVGVTNIHWRMTAMEANMVRFEKLMDRMVTVQEKSMKHEAKFEVGVMEYMGADLKRDFPHAKKEDK